jgi:hypothetical protein
LAKQARDAGERLSRTRKKPSFEVQLLEAFRTIFAGGTKKITSVAITSISTGDPNKRMGRVQSGWTNHAAADCGSA